MQISQNRGESIKLDRKKLDSRIPFYMKVIIFLFPFATFIGSYLNVSVISLSNIYSLLLMFLVFRQLLKGRLNYIKGYILFFSVMIMYSLFTIIWSRYSPIGMTIFLPLVTGFVCMAFVASLDYRNLNLFLRSMSIFTYIVLLIALYETLFGSYILFDNNDFIYVLNKYGFHYPGVAFANPNDLAQYLVCIVPIILAKQFDEKKVFLPTIIFLVTLFILFNTNSRLSIISIFIIVFGYFIVFLSKNKLIFKRGLFTGVLLYVLINLVSVIGIDLKTFDLLDNFLLINSSMDYFTGRSVLYTEAFALGVENLILGAGLGGSYAVTTIGTHNMFLFIFSDLGILFAVGFILFLFFLFIKLYRYRKMKLINFHFASLMLSILVAFPIVSSMSSANEQRKIIWLILGLMLSVLSNYKEKTKLLAIDKRSESCHDY
ncbi:O-antigen ligase family protein [Ruoffia sp. FAM 20857]|uniref:O-antigen ligase family protein n=1 Tax=Ruoffia sp. FAM 20857 TaxID=3259515 RepID=UPI003889110C